MSGKQRAESDAGSASRIAVAREGQKSSRQETDLGRLIELLPESVLLINQDRRIIELNRPAQLMFGKRKDILNMQIDIVLSEGSRNVLIEAVRKHFTTKSTKRRLTRLELTGIEANGSEIDMDMRLESGPGSPPTVLMCFVTDATAAVLAERSRTRSIRALRFSSLCMQALVRAKEEPSLLADICRIAVDEGGYRMSWIGYAENDKAKTVRAVAQAGDEHGYLDSIKISWANNTRGRGPTGTCIRTGKPSVCRNILTDPKFVSWRGPALKRGYESSIALPLSTADSTFGALNIYAIESDAFDQRELDLLVQLARALSYGIRSLRTSVELQQSVKELRISEEKYRVLVETMGEGLIVFDSSDLIIYVNDRLCDFAGRSRDELVGQKPGKYLCDGRKPISPGQVMAPYEANITDPEGKTRAVRVSPQVLSDDDDRTVGSFCVVTDISDRKRAEQELLRANEQLSTEQEALHRKNIALNEVLKQIEQEKISTSERISGNIEKIILPTLHRLKDGLTEAQKAQVASLERDLFELTSPFVDQLRVTFSRLTPRELEICNLVKGNMTSKEIASLLNLSLTTVHKHREAIRDKLGLTNTKSNLTSFLANL